MLGLIDRPESTPAKKQPVLFFAVDGSAWTARGDVVSSVLNCTHVFIPKQERGRGLSKKYSKWGIIVRDLFYLCSPFFFGDFYGNFIYKIMYLVTFTWSYNFWIEIIEGESIEQTETDCLANNSPEVCGLSGKLAVIVVKNRDRE